MPTEAQNDAQELFMYAINNCKSTDEDIQLLLTQEEITSTEIAALALKTISLYTDEYCEPDWKPSDGAYGLLKKKLMEFFLQNMFSELFVGVGKDMPVDKENYDLVNALVERVRQETPWTIGYVRNGTEVTYSGDFTSSVPVPVDEFVGFLKGLLAPFSLKIEFNEIDKTDLED